jgi:hypothetical protein
LFESIIFIIEGHTQTWWNISNRDGKTSHSKGMDYFFVGDTSGNNRWFGHFNGSGKMTCPYRVCVCPFHDMGSVMPHCQYITIADYYWNKTIRSSLSTNAGAKKDVDKSWSKHDIDNDFMQPHCLYQTRSMVYSA